MSDSMARGFVSKLNKWNTRSIELGEPLFSAVDQVQRHRGDFPIAGMRLKGDFQVTFVDGSRAIWDAIKKWWYIDIPGERVANRTPTPPPDDFPKTPLPPHVCETIEAYTDRIRDLQDQIAMLDCLLSTVDGADEIAHVLRDCVGVDDAFVIRAQKERVDIGVVCSDEQLFAEMSSGFDLTPALDGAVLTIKRLEDTEQFFMRSPKGGAQ